ncbi:MAG: hypothetical protein WCT46_03605 [Candidatus Gracilibacteria bacterium]
MRKILLVLLVVFSLVSPVYAIEYGGIGGYPANPDPENTSTNQWFIYTLNLGETIEDSIIIENTSSEAVNVKLYPADYTASTDGGFALEQEVESRDEVGSWVTLSATGLVVEAMSQIVVPFTITVPNDSSVDVGEHMGGILIEKVSDEEGSEGGLQINLRVGVRIYITIPGEVSESVAVGTIMFDTNLDKRIGVVTTNIENSGNVSENVKVSTSVENVYPIFDKIWSYFPVENERSLQVLRDDDLVSNFEFNLPLFSYVKINSKIEYTDKNGEIVTVEADPVQTWIYPPLMWSIITIASIFGILFFLGVMLFLKIKDRKSHKYFY